MDLTRQSHFNNSHNAPIQIKCYSRDNWIGLNLDRNVKLINLWLCRAADVADGTKNEFSLFTYVASDLRNLFARLEWQKLYVYVVKIWWISLLNFNVKRSGSNPEPPSSGAGAWFNHEKINPETYPNDLIFMQYIFEATTIPLCC